MTRIVWTKEEKKAVHDCMVDLCYAFPSYSNKALFRAAQEEVIHYQRRTVVNDQRVFNYKIMIASARAKAEEHRAKVASKPAPTPPPVIAPEPVKKLDTLGEVFELFIDALADRIIDKMINAKQQVELQEISVPDAFDKAFDILYPLRKNFPAKIKRPTALVIGLNGAQMECIKLSQPKVDFTFLSAEQALSHATYNKEHTFLMTKFINHSVQGKYRKHPNLHYVNGGVSDLKTILHGIFHKETV
jgi:hypothetical protein